MFKDVDVKRGVKRPRRASQPQHLRQAAPLTCTHSPTMGLSATFVVGQWPYLKHVSWALLRRWTRWTWWVSEGAWLGIVVLSGLSLSELVLLYTTSSPNPHLSKVQYLVDQTLCQGMISSTSSAPSFCAHRREYAPTSLPALLRLRWPHQYSWSITPSDDWPRRVTYELTHNVH